MWKSVCQTTARQPDHVDALACNLLKITQPKRKRIDKSGRHWHNLSALRVRLPNFQRCNECRSRSFEPLETSSDANETRRNFQPFEISAAYFYHFIIQFSLFTLPASVTHTEFGAYNTIGKNSEQPIKWIIRFCDQWINRWMNEWMSKRTNKRTKWSEVEWTWVNLKKWEFDTSSFNTKTRWKRKIFEKEEER